MQNNKKFIIIKFLAFFLVFSLLILSILTFFLLSSNLPQKYAKQYIKHHINNELGVNLTFQSLKGNIYSNIKIDNITCYESVEKKTKIISLKSAELNYNILKIIFKKTSILEAIDTIVLTNLNYFIIRGKNGKWINIKQKKEKQYNTEKKEKNLNLNTKIFIKDSTIYLSDHKGWKKNSQKTQFKTNITNIEGSLIFKGNNIGVLNSSGLLKGTSNRVPFTGKVNLKNKDFDLYSEGINLNLNTWAEYALPITGFHAFSGNALLNCHITNAKFNTNKKNPLWYYLKFQLKHSAFYTPYISNKLNNTNGQLLISKGYINNDLLNSLKHPFSKTNKKTILKVLKEKNIISKRLSLTTSSTEKRNNITFFKKNYLNKKIAPHINEPSIVIKFNKITTTIENIQTNINGYINFKDKWINLKINPNTFNSNKIQQFFPETKNLSLKNNIDMKLNIIGLLKNPQLIGSAKTNNLKCLFLNLNNVESKFKLHNNIFKFNITKASYLNGLLTNETIITNIKNKPTISTKTYISELNPKRLITNSLTTGNIDAICKLTGQSNILTGNIQVLGKDVTFMNQKLNSIKSNIVINSKETKFNKINIFLNDSSSPSQATINIKNNHIYISNTIKDLKITDPFETTYNLNSNLNLNTNFHFPLAYKSNSLLNFILETTGRLNLSIINPKLNNQTFNLAKLTIKTKNKQLLISTFNLQSANESIQLSGYYSEKKHSDIKLTINNMSLKRINAFNILPPSFIKFPNSNISTEIYYKKNINTPSSIHGQSQLSNISLFNNLIQNINLKFKTSKNIIKFKDIIAKSKYNFINGSGNYNTKTNELNLNLNPNSYLFIETIKTPFLEKPPIKGKINIDKTTISYEQNKLKFKSKINSNKLIINNNTITDLSLNLSYQNDKYKIKTLDGSINNGSFYLKGVIEKEPNDIVNYYLSPKFSKININQVQSIWNSISNSIKKKQPKSDAFLSAFKIESPFSNNQNITIISSEKNQKSEIEFINLLLKTTKSNFINQKSYLNIFQGTLDGKLDIIGKTTQLPIINGTLSITNLSIPNIQTNKNTLSFKSTKNLTNFTVHSQKGFINQSPIENIKINGSFSKDLILNLYSNTITTKEDKIHNFAIGNLTVPLFNSNKSHPINLNLNFSKSNMTVLEFINPLLSKTEFNGNLNLHIAGTLENPIFNSTKNSGQTINLVHQNTNFNIPTNKIMLSNNTLNLRSFNVTKESTKNNYIFPFFNSPITGHIKLKEFNLLDPNYIITNVNLHSPFAKTNLKTKTFKSNIEFKNTTLTGNIIIGLNNTSINAQYKNKNIAYPIFKSDIKLSNTSIAIPEASSHETYPLDLNINVDIEKNVFFNSPIFGNTIFGINADLEFQETDQPLNISGTTNDIAINNQITIENGSVTLLNKVFNIIPPSKQHIFSTGTNQTILQNTIGIQTEFNTSNQAVITPKLSFKALCTIENPKTSTENTLITFTHIIMSINDTINSLNEIRFEVFESTIETPSTISDLTFMKQFSIENQTNTNSIASDQSDINELLTLLLPELYTKTVSDELLASLGESQINSLVRQSILRPLEKTVAKQVGLNDIRINYNLGSKLIDNTEDTLGIQFIKNIISDRLILKLLTNTSFEKEDDTSTNSNFELSEIELSYYLLKNKNLSLNYNNYKSTNFNNKYLSKLSMRYDYEF